GDRGVVLSKKARAMGVEALRARADAKAADLAGCGLQRHGSDCRRRPRQNRVRQSLPLSDSETTARESFSDGWVGSARPRKRIYGPAGVQQTALEKRELVLA